MSRLSKQYAATLEINHLFFHLHTPNQGEAGAISRLSEKCVCEIAFVGEDALEENCNQEEQENQDWCMEIDQYLSLGQIGIIPK